MLEVYTNYNHLEKGQNSSCKETTEESNNCATGGKNLSKKLVCLKNRIKIKAENPIILLGTSAAATPSLDHYMCFWSFFVKRETWRQGGKRKTEKVEVHWGGSIKGTVKAVIVSFVTKTNNWGYLLLMQCKKMLKSIKRTKAKGGEKTPLSLGSTMWNGCTAFINVMTLCRTWGLGFIIQVYH